MSGINSVTYEVFFGEGNELVNRRKIKNDNYRCHDNAIKALYLLSTNVLFPGKYLNSREKHFLKRTSLIEVADFRETNSHFFRRNSGKRSKPRTH